MNYFVYALEHIYTDDTHTACKFLGYFDDLEILKRVKKKSATLNGFSMYPDGFVINKKQLNKINWQNGFEKVVGEIGRDYLEDDDEIDYYSILVKKLNLKYVFQISHNYTINAFLDDERIIGIFLDENEANTVVADLRLKDGFKKYPDDFIVDRFTLNNPLWISGF